MFLFSWCYVFFMVNILFIQRLGILYFSGSKVRYCFDIYKCYERMLNGSNTMIKSVYKKFYFFRSPLLQIHTKNQG